jgi:hypothetical protein
LRLIAARPDVFCRQGHLAASYRSRNGKTFGPYYRLGYRIDGRQYSIYLGRSEKLAERVRQALGAIQKPLAQRRLFNQLERQIRSSLRVEKLRLNSLLRPFGLRLKGFECRGWRYSPLRRFLPSRRRWRPRVGLRRAKLAKSLPPVVRLRRFMVARDGPKAENGDWNHACLSANPVPGSNEAFVVRMMRAFGFGSSVGYASGQ